MFLYTLTLEFPNQTSIISFYLGFLETYLHWNKGTSINDFITDVIVRTTSIFINLKFHLFIEINYQRLSIIVYFFYHARKENKLTCCGRASTKLYISQGIHFAKKGCLLCESRRHSTSMHRERVHVREMPRHDWHLATHTHQKGC
jgi:hypothetical protein